MVSGRSAQPGRPRSGRLEPHLPNELHRASS
jgi:hypothetical protein